MKRWICAILALWLIVGLAGCREGQALQSVPESETAVTFTDDLGRVVTVDRPRRVACLIGSFADIWHLAGGTDTIVAAANDTWTYFDIPLGEDVVNLGGTKSLSVEQLVACQPDFVIASCNTALNVELEDTFEKMGLNVAYFRVSTFDDYLHMLDICTRIIGCRENYRRYGEDVRAQVDSALNRADGSRPTVLCLRVTGSGSKVKGSAGNVLGEMLYDLDCANIADSDGSLLDQLSMEAILREDPEFIFAVLQSSDPAAARQVLESTLLSHPAWQSLTAVKEGRFYLLNPELYNLKPNAKWGDAYEALADILYPAG